MRLRGLADWGRRARDGRGTPSTPLAPEAPPEAPDSDDDGPLTRHLKWWLRHLAPGRSWSLGNCVHRLFRFSRASKTSLACIGGLFMITAGEFAIHNSIRALCVMSAVYSCFVANLFLGQRSHLLVDIFKGMASLTEELECRADSKSQQQMRRTARRFTYLINFLLLSGVLQQVLYVYSSTKQNTHASWPTSAARGIVRSYDRMLGWTPGVEPAAETVAALATWLRFGVMPFHFCVAIFSRISFYTYLLLDLVMCAVLVDLFDVVGRAVEVSRCAQVWPRAQSKALQLSVDMCTTTIDVNPHGTFVILVGPLFSTVELVSNGIHGDKYALGLVTILVTMFVPLCLLGDALKEARLCVGDRAYRGPWLEESRRERAVRLGMMHSAGVGRDTLLRARGCGPIDRVFCSQALKNWFTFLQYLLNIGQPNTK